MSDINKLFLSFNDNITLTKSKADDLKRGRDSLRDKIKKWFEDNSKSKPNFCWQGSFAMKTTINPLEGGEYDLDDGVYLNGFSEMAIEDWPASSTVHSWIKKAVDGHTSTSIIDKDTCIRVVYASGYHIDLPIYIIKDEKVYLAHKTDGWSESDPKAFKDWVVNAVTENGEQLRSIIKYLKAWKNFKDISLKGIELSILAVENFSEYEGRDEKALLLTVENIIETLELEFSCAKPVAPGNDLFEGTSETKQNNILNGLNNLKKKLKLAIDEEDELKASEYMIKVFGTRFPKGNSTVKKEENSVYERTAAPGVLKHDGRSA